MNPLRSNMQIGVQHILVVHLLAVLGTALLSFAVGSKMTSGWTAGIATSLGLVVTTAFMFRIIHRLARWDKELAGIAFREELRLEHSPHSTPADFGWNRIVETSQRWGGLAELAETVGGVLEQHDGASSQLLDLIPDAIVRVDADGRILYANAMMAALVGIDSPQQLLNKPLAQAFGDSEQLEQRLAEQPHLPHAVVEWTQSTGNTDEESQHRTLRGSRRVVPSGVQGESVGYVWTIRDVTQQRLADDMRDQFLAAATHEFRTPLANIRAYAESLDMGHDIDAESRKRFYNVIQSESLRLSQLVDDLLDISRMQAGALALEERETDLERLVREAAAKVQGQMEEHHLQFRCELPPKFPKATLDKGKLVAALVNLLGNAAKYTPDGGQVTFRVDVTPQQLQFSVSDTGIGIAPEELPRIFDRFFRCNDDRVHNVSGSGLGLALAQQVARLHGGDLMVESVLNRGSTFRMSIPLNSVA